MTLGDVVPPSSRARSTAPIGGIVVWTPMHFQDAAKYVTETGQPAVFAIAEVSKSWYDPLPADLQKIVDNDAAAQQAAIGPLATEIVNKARKGWTDSGGELIGLPSDEETELMKIFLTTRLGGLEDEAGDRSRLQDRDRGGGAHALRRGDGDQRGRRRSGLVR